MVNVAVREECLKKQRAQFRADNAGKVIAAGNDGSTPLQIEFGTMQSLAKHAAQCRKEFAAALSNPNIPIHDKCPGEVGFLIPGYGHRGCYLQEITPGSTAKTCAPEDYLNRVKAAVSNPFENNTDPDEKCQLYFSLTTKCEAGMTLSDGSRHKAPCQLLDYSRVKAKGVKGKKGCFSENSGACVASCPKVNLTCSDCGEGGKLDTMFGEGDDGIATVSSKMFSGCGAKCTAGYKQKMRAKACGGCDGAAASTTASTTAAPAKTVNKTTAGTGSSASSNMAVLEKQVAAACAGNKPANGTKPHRAAPARSCEKMKALLAEAKKAANAPRTSGKTTAAPGPVDKKAKVRATLKGKRDALKGVFDKFKAKGCGKGAVAKGSEAAGRGRRVAHGTANMTCAELNTAFDANKQEARAVYAKLKAARAACKNANANATRFARESHAGDDADIAALSCNEIDAEIANLKAQASAAGLTLEASTSGGVTTTAIGTTAGGGAVAAGISALVAVAFAQLA